MHCNAATFWGGGWRVWQFREVFLKDTNWVVVQINFNFHPYLGKITILTNTFQMGWNHQLENDVGTTHYFEGYHSGSIYASSSWWFQKIVYPKDWQFHEHSLMIEAASWGLLMLGPTWWLYINLFDFHPYIPGVSWSNLTGAYCSNGLGKNHQLVVHRHLKKCH